MKIPVLTIGSAVLGIAIGYVAGKSGGSDVERPVPTDHSARSFPSRASASRDTSGTRHAPIPADGELASILKGRDIRALTSRDLIDLFQSQATPDWSLNPLAAARRAYELQLLVSRLPPSVIEDTLALADEAGIARQRIHQLFSAFVSRDSHRALEWAETQPDPDRWRAAAISVLAGEDPARAEELFRDALVNGLMERQGGFQWQASHGLAVAHAKSGKDALLAFVDTLPGQLLDSALSSATGSLPLEDLPAFLEEVHRRKQSGEIQAWTFGNILRNLDSRSAGQTREWLSKLEPGKERANQEIAFAGVLNHQGKTEEAFALIKSAMAQMSGGEKAFFMENARTLLWENPSLVVELARNLPAESTLTYEDVNKFTQNHGHSRPAIMVDAARLLDDPKDQARILTNSLGKLENNKQLNATDFQILTQRIQSLSLPSEAAAEVQQALDATREKALGSR